MTKFYNVFINHDELVASFVTYEQAIEVSQWFMAEGYEQVDICLVAAK